MADSIKILYNGVDAFAPQPLPFLSLDEQPVSYGEYWAKAQSVTLNGQLTGCTFDDLYSAYQNLVEKFKKNYQNFEIWQIEGATSGRIFLKENTQIDSISIPDSNWVGVLPYSISLSCYPSGFFSGFYGVLDPVDEWNFSEQGNATLDISHNISCRGLNTSNSTNNALENAKNWVLAKTGVNTNIFPIFISGVSSNNFCLLTQNETIDRINGTYSITENYTNDLARTGYGIIRYETSFESGDQKITVTLNGRAEGCGQNLSGVRAAFQNLDKYAVALRNYNRIFNRSDLNPNPISHQINEDALEATVEFSYTYDNDNSPESYFDYTVSLTSGESIGASIEGNVISRGGDLATRLQKSINFAKTLNLYNLTTEFYNQFYPNYASFPLNPKPISSGIGINEYEGTVSLNAEFDNKEQVLNGLDAFEYSIQIRPSLIRFDAKPKLDGIGDYSVVSLNFNSRASLTINGTAIISDSTSAAAGLQIIKNKCQQLLFRYGRLNSPVLEQDSITFTSSDEKRVSFSFAWSFASFPVNSSYSAFSSLSV